MAGSPCSCAEHGKRPGRLALFAEHSRLDDIIYRIIRTGERAAPTRAIFSPCSLRLKPRMGGRMTDRQVARRGDDPLPSRPRDHRQRSRLDLVLLSLHPEVEDPAALELAKCWPGARARWEDVPRLHQLNTQMIVKESLRAVPARVGHRPRNATGDPARRLPLPAGTNVIHQPVGPQRDPPFFRSAP